MYSISIEEDDMHRPLPIPKGIEPDLEDFMQKMYLYHIQSFANAAQQSVSGMFVIATIKLTMDHGDALHKSPPFNIWPAQAPLSINNLLSAFRAHTFFTFHVVLVSTYSTHSDVFSMDFRFDQHAKLIASSPITCKTLSSFDHSVIGLGHRFTVTQLPTMIEPYKSLYNYLIAGQGIQLVRMMYGMVECFRH